MDPDSTQEAATTQVSAVADPGRKAKPRRPAADGSLALAPKRKPEARSRITNGADVLPGVDGRTLIARRFYDICQALISDQGGQTNVSEAKIQMIRRFAAACVMAEAMEAKLARGEEINITEQPRFRPRFAGSRTELVSRGWRGSFPVLAICCTEATEARMVEVSKHRGYLTGRF